MIIGLSGRRRSGKSTIATHLVEQHRFQRVHPFEGGKQACRGYFIHAGATPAQAFEMTDGALKDTPCPFLPDQATPRTFMEQFGYFMANMMGTAWTIGVEIERVRRQDPDARPVVESVVYEADEIQRQGGHVIMVERPSLESDMSAIRGERSDDALSLVDQDSTFVNDAETVDEVLARLDDHLSAISSLQLIPSEPELSP